ncbi:MAG: single-stranded-DNA-specific exonuclease RecJ [Flavobacteriaceae bacterium]|nr:single-stranded-DNA-specific exonuclease RecJ [Flavobacteriaceae bacterium]
MRWESKSTPDSKKVKDIQEALQIPETIAILLIQRGIEDFESAKAFFRPQLTDLHDPFLMQDMQEAVERIDQGCRDQDALMIYGDYDVDGTTSVSLVYSFLKPFFQKIIPYIPDRYTEGYGISYQGIDVAAEKGVRLIIALDCGIKAVEKVKYAQSKGIDFIICDHHLPAEKIPDAVAVLDPKRSDCNYPYKELCGCGIGFKLIQALTTFWKEDPKELYSYLDLVATAIAADIVPMTGENRILAFYGIEQLRRDPRIGLKPLISHLKNPPTVTDLVFIIAPRINAAGRMDNALNAVKLLVEKEPNAAEQFATIIETLNSERRTTDERITKEALNLIDNLGEQDRYSTVVCSKGWHKGVIGIVASRLIETHYRPTVVFSVDDDNMVGSVRSVKGFNVYEALEACKSHIVQFGGHKYAAGLTIKKNQYEAFKKAFERAVQEHILPEQRIPKVVYDLEVSLSELTPKLFRILEQLGPFGPQNMRPVFRTNNVLDSGHSKAVGKDGSHLRLSIQTESSPMIGIAFSQANFLNHIQSKKPFDLVYTLDENEWNGQTSLQLKVKDLMT